MSQKRSLRCFAFSSRNVTPPTVVLLRLHGQAEYSGVEFFSKPGAGDHCVIDWISLSST